VVRDLRRIKENQGNLTLEQIAMVCGYQSQPQVHRLAREFPVLKHTPLIYGLLRMCATSPSMVAALVSDRGLPFSPAVAEVLRPENTKPINLRFDKAKIVAVRFTTAISRSDGVSKEITFGFVTSDSGWQPVYGFTQTEKRQGANQGGIQ
jgi:hypothetical protein